MKRLFCLMLFLPFLLACEKENKSETLCFDGLVKWHGDPAADGLGWVIVEDDSLSVFRPYIPQNLPEDLKIDNLKIAACIYETDEKFHCFCARPLNKYGISSIKRR